MCPVTPRLSSKTLNIYHRRLAGSPDKIAFLKGTMNIVDCLAIAPYYLTLFFFPDPEIRVSQEDDLYSTVMPANSEEEEESGFGDVGRIMQVRIRHNSIKQKRR